MSRPPRWAGLIETRVPAEYIAQCRCRGQGRWTWWTKWTCGQWYRTPASRSLVPPSISSIPSTSSIALPAPCAQRLEPCLRPAHPLLLRQGFHLRQGFGGQVGGQAGPHAAGRRRARAAETPFASSSAGGNVPLRNVAPASLGGLDRNPRGGRAHGAEPMPGAGPADLVD